MTSNYYNGPKLKFHEIMDLYKKKNKITQKDGYIYIYLPEHPNAQKGGYIRFHRLVLEEHLGRYLKRGERTHHINRIKNDNQIENLKLFPNESEHQSNSPHRYGHFIYKGRKKEYDKEYYIVHREKIKEASRLYRKLHPEHIKEYSKKYRLTYKRKSLRKDKIKSIEAKIKEMEDKVNERNR